MDPVTIISQSITTGGLTGARPALTLFLLQLYGMFMAKPVMPEGTEWLLNEYVVGVCGALVVVEHFVRTEPDFEELMKIPNQIIGVVVALSGALLLTGLGDNPERWKAIGDLGGPTFFTAGAGGQGGAGTLTFSMIVAAASSVGVHWLRSRLMEGLDALAVPSRWWRWIEAGGVTGVVAMVVLLPFLALALAIAMFTLSALVAGGVWYLRKSRDQKQRRDCPNPSCDYRPRVEATLCPECEAALTPVEPAGLSDKAAKAS
jgi:hypothetical protein